MDLNVVPANLCGCCQVYILAKKYVNTVADIFSGTAQRFYLLPETPSYQARVGVLCTHGAQLDIWPLPPRVCDVHVCDGCRAGAVVSIGGWRSTLSTGTQVYHRHRDLGSLGHHYWPGSDWKFDASSTFSTDPSPVWAAAEFPQGSFTIHILYPHVYPMIFNLDHFLPFFCIPECSANFWFWFWMQFMTEPQQLSELWISTISQPLNANISSHSRPIIENVTPGFGLYSWGTILHFLTGKYPRLTCSCQDPQSFWIWDKTLS